METEKEKMKEKVEMSNDRDDRKSNNENGSNKDNSLQGHSKQSKDARKGKANEMEMEMEMEKEKEKKKEKESWNENENNQGIASSSTGKWNENENDKNDGKDEKEARDEVDEILFQRELDNGLFAMMIFDNVYHVMLKYPSWTKIDYIKREIESKLRKMEINIGIESIGTSKTCPIDLLFNYCVECKLIELNDQNEARLLKHGNNRMTQLIEMKCRNELYKSNVAYITQDTKKSGKLRQVLLTLLFEFQGERDKEWGWSYIFENCKIACQDWLFIDANLFLCALIELFNNKYVEILIDFFQPNANQIEFIMDARLSKDGIDQAISNKFCGKNNIGKMYKTVQNKIRSNIYQMGEMDVDAKSRRNYFYNNGHSNKLVLSRGVILLKVENVTLDRRIADIVDELQVSNDAQSFAKGAEWFFQRVHAVEKEKEKEKRINEKKMVQDVCNDFHFVNLLKHLFLHGQTYIQSRNYEKLCCLLAIIQCVWDNLTCFYKAARPGGRPDGRQDVTYVKQFWKRIDYMNGGLTYLLDSFTTQIGNTIGSNDYNIYYINEHGKEKKGLLKQVNEMIKTWFQACQERSKKIDKEIENMIDNCDNGNQGNLTDERNAYKTQLQNHWIEIGELLIWDYTYTLGQWPRYHRDLLLRPEQAAIGVRFKQFSESTTLFVEKGISLSSDSLKYFLDEKGPLRRGRLSTRYGDYQALNNKQAMPARNSNDIAQKVGFQSPSLMSSNVASQSSSR